MRSDWDEPLTSWVPQDRDPGIEWGVYFKLVASERRDLYVTDPAEKAAIIAASPFAPKRLR